MAVFAKGLTFEMGQTHVHSYLPALMEHIRDGDIDATLIITHRGSLEDAPALCDTFRNKRDGCVKVVLRP